MASWRAGSPPVEHTAPTKSGTGEPIPIVYLSGPNEPALPEWVCETLRRVSPDRRPTAHFPATERGATERASSTARTVGGFDNGPCALCRTETPCSCPKDPPGSGRPGCRCTCGRCRYPFPLADDGPLR